MPERVIDLSTTVPTTPARTNVVSTVFIECGAMHSADAPNRCGPWADRVRQRHRGDERVRRVRRVRIAAGIVGTADLGRATASPRCSTPISPGGVGRGIRQSALSTPMSLPPPRINPVLACTARRLRAGFKHLAPRNLSFEVWCYHSQITEVTALARAFPETTMILNHFGGPLGVGGYAGKADAVFAEWRPRLVELAKCPNVVAKLGGINMEINGFGWHERPRPPASQELMEATRRYYEFTIEQFGVDRCLFESNFPVDKASCSYTVLWNSFKWLTASYSASEKPALPRPAARSRAQELATSGRRQVELLGLAAVGVSAVGT